MPPTYKPLSVGIQGLPPEIFGAPQVQSINDYVKENEAVETQQLNNEVQALALAEKQRQVEENQRVREALKSNFSLNSEGFDNDQALEIAQGIALQNGDLDTALAVEKARKERTGGHRIISQSERDYLNQFADKPLPEDASEDFVKLAQGYARLDQGDRRIGQADTRLDIYGRTADANIGKIADEKASRAPGGWEADINPINGGGPTKKDGEEFTKLAALQENINYELDQLHDLVMNGEESNPADPSFQAARQHLSQIQILLKDKHNFGAALSVNEQKLNSGVLPRLLADPSVSATDALIAEGLGQDPLDAIETFRDLSAAEFNNIARARKFKPLGGASQFGTRIQPSLDQVTEQVANGPSSGGRVPGAPRPPRLSFEDWKKLPANQRP